MGKILKNRETLCSCGENMIRECVLIQRDDYLVNICECICGNIYIIKLKPFNFKQFTREEFIYFLNKYNIDINPKEV